ncbi:GntP family permease [Roseomonas sp. NAR14]|uniref:GntP family permease n=1 Tax=Roseomonas acroporae TaxID=2937791 RepID=A0A9X2BV33_9PROT|nr:GntP family permease [Roseomonas acroporae]MCK8786237.1 GntP family permease [Roseomonas acroporae]
MGLLGILVGLGLLMGLAYRGWSVLLLAPLGALVAAAFAGEPLLANWTQTFMSAAGGFIAQFFPLFLLGGVFGKLMGDSGSITAIADFMTRKLGTQRAILAVVLAGALVTYGGVNLFVAFFVLGPMAHAMFRAADVPYRLMPATIMLAASSFTMSAMPGTPAIQNAIPMPFFGTSPWAAPGLGLIASAVMAGLGIWWLEFRAAQARRAGEGYGTPPADVQGIADQAADDPVIREHSAVTGEFDTAELHHGRGGQPQPSFAVAVAPIAVVLLVNLLMTGVVLPSMDTAFLNEPRWGETSIAAVGGVWSVVVALFFSCLVLVALNFQRLPSLRATLDAGANSAVLPVIGVGSLVGFGAVVAALPAFAAVRDQVLGIGGGPLVSLAVATNVLAALTGSASGGLTIALDTLGGTYLQLAAEHGIDPALLHRVAVIGAGTLDALPHNGAVVTLLAVCGSDHRRSYMDLFMTTVVTALVALVVVIVLGSLLGTF